jgi:hypothetical protein
MKNLVTKHFLDKFSYIFEVIQGITNSEKFKFALFKYKGIRLSSIDRFNQIDISNIAKEEINIKEIAQWMTNFIGDYIIELLNIDQINVSNLEEVFNHDWVDNITKTIENAGKHDVVIYDMIRTGDYSQEYEIKNELDGYRKIVKIIKNL